eukprot:scaffold362639_cov52-Prasinocladus_malaysianus.AAC.1
MSVRQYPALILTHEPLVPPASLSDSGTPRRSTGDPSGCGSDVFASSWQTGSHAEGGVRLDAVRPDAASATTSRQKTSATSGKEDGMLWLFFWRDGYGRLPRMHLYRYVYSSGANLTLVFTGNRACRFSAPASADWVSEDNRRTDALTPTLFRFWSGLLFGCLLYENPYGCIRKSYPYFSSTDFEHAKLTV